MKANQEAFLSMKLGQDFLLIIMNRKETEGKAPEKELKVNS